MKKQAPQFMTPDLPLTPGLRGHHLICLHFYNGEGYSEDFIKYLSEVLAIAEKGNIEICDGADCICSACPHLRGNACAYYEGAEADIRRMDAKALELLNLDVGQALSWKSLRKKASEILPQWHSLYCCECDWQAACKKGESYRSLITTQH